MEMTILIFMLSNVSTKGCGKESGSGMLQTGR